MAVRDCAERGEFGAVTARDDGVSDTHAVAAEREARCVHIHHNGGSAGDLNKLERAEADGARADDQHIFPGLHASAVNGVTTDAQRLDQSELLVAEFR